MYLAEICWLTNSEYRLAKLYIQFFIHCDSSFVLLISDVNPVRYRCA